MVSILLPPLNFCWIVDAQQSRVNVAAAAAAAAADNGGETAALHIVACLGGSRECCVKELLAQATHGARMQL